MPNDSCWMFKVVDGPISVYSIVAIDDDMVVEPALISAIQFNNGILLQFDEDNLLPMLHNDDEALKQLRKKNYLKAIKKYNTNHTPRQKTGFDGD